MPVLEIAEGCIVSKLGDLTVGFALEKPEIFTLGVEDYSRLHESFVKAVKLLAPGTILHLQDFYWEDRWRAEDRGGDQGSFLAGASDGYFTGRGYLRHTAYCYITRRATGGSLPNSAGSGLLRRWVVPPGTLDERSLGELREMARQFSRVLNDSGLIGIRPLTTAELASSADRAGLIEQYCYLLDGPQPVLRDIDFTDGLRVGDRQAVLYTLADAGGLPAQCSPARFYEKYSSEQSKVFVGFLSSLGLLLPYNHLVNQYLVVGDGPATWKRLERKRLRMKSLSRYSRANALAAEAANAYLAEAIAEQRTPVRVHVDVLAWTCRPSGIHERPAQPGAQISELKSALVSAIAAMGAVPHEETVGAPQLWWAAIPGNAGDLPDNECWDTFVEQACCFLQYESNYRDSPGSFGVRLGDRLTGRPVFVDLDVTPRQLGWTQNGNMFVLAGSGGGKSFFMNHLCRTYYDLGMHIVLIDVGHSYRGLCDLLGGYYFTYEESRPMQFNPFYIGPGEAFDTGKKESLKSLLMALWKRSDETQYRSEYVALSNALQTYYERLASRPETSAPPMPAGDSSHIPGFDGFYEFMAGEYREIMREQGVKPKEFDLENFLYVVRPYYRGGEFDFLLNGPGRLDLLHQRFIVFELDNIKDHPILFPVVTLVIMEVFLTKMRQLRGVRKMIVIEEAWKAIANAGMASNIRYWVKTLRKFMGKLALVSQEVEDIIESPIVKQAIINNSDTRVLLDQSKFQNRFDAIQSLLGLTDKQKAEILSINRGHDAGRPYKDLWIGLGPSMSHVYRLEVSPEEYWVYTSDQGDKVRLEEYVRRHGDIRNAVETMARAGVR
jgi:conjugation system TraG family ATPase